MRAVRKNARERPEASRLPGDEPGHFRAGLGLRASLATIGILEAVVFGAALRLPWRHVWALTSACVLLTALHGALCVAAIAGHSRGLERVWRALAWTSLAFLAGATWAIFTSAWYIARLFEGVGPGLGAALAAVWGLVVLFTLPIAAWGLVSTRRARSAPARVVGGIGLVTLMAASSAFAAHGATSNVRPVDVEAVESMLTATLRDTETFTRSEARLADVRAPDCGASPADASFTLLVGFVERRDQKANMICLQRGSLSEVGRDLHALLTTRAFAAPLVVDVIIATRPLDGWLPWLDPVKLRPGIDGACHGPRCVAPWQLVARDRFMSLSLPIDTDAKLGVSSAALGVDLNAVGDSLAGIVRFESVSWVARSDRSLVRLHHTRPIAPPLARGTVTNAHRAAKGHLLRALGADGRFRYLLDPFGGAVDDPPFSFARHAGVTLSLCELGGKGADVRDAAMKALAHLATYERSVAADVSTLLRSGESKPRLASVALPLAAMLACRDLVGDTFDPLAGRLARFILRLQEESGGFAPSVDVDASTFTRGAKPLYVEGQAVLALVLLEGLLSRPAGELSDSARAVFPPHEQIRAAVGAAMDYVATRYWSHPLRGFFFVEETWHCLAARAALATHRHDGYERFCIDYVTFKSRLVAGKGAAPHAVGGYSPAAVTLPQNTPTASIGEALAASVAIKRRRGAPVDRELDVLRDVVGFLVRAQWDRASCFACAKPDDVVGGFSRHLASPIIRIDYVQHAWSAIGHGGRALGLLEEG